MAPERLERVLLVGTHLRGRHYGQRPRAPHQQVEHMAAPTSIAEVRKALPTESRPHMAALLPSPESGFSSPPGFRVERKISAAGPAPLRGLEQLLSNEFAFADPARAGEQAAADVGGELVEGVEVGHGLEDPDEPVARIALVAQEEKARV